jgi:hypothetical protein
MSLLFGTFLRMIKSSIKTYFQQDNLVVFERSHRELGLTFFYFSTFQTLFEPEAYKHSKVISIPGHSVLGLSTCIKEMTSLMFLICFSLYFQPFKQHYDFLIIGGGLGKHHSLQKRNVSVRPVGPLAVLDPDTGGQK